MLSSQSKTIATATVLLFRRFTAVSGFRPLKTQSAAISTLTTRNFHQSLVSQGFTEKPKSQWSASQSGQERKSSLRRHLSSGGRDEEKIPQKASFSVPSMGTDPNDENTMTTKQYSEYEKWVRRLYATNMFHPVKLGLENMHLLHELLGSPMDDPNRVVVHVAGTNGKGSVCLKIANTLRSQKRRKPSPFSDGEENDGQLNVGIFCSPHVSSFRERMQVNGKMITEEEVVELLPQIYDLCLPENHDIPATFFEITTALAFLFFAKRGADVVVLETGLGGRLDATNVIASPALSIITSIGLEHTRILGDTIELIAREKGGIIKKDCPVLVGQHCPHDVLMQCAREKESGRYYSPSLVEGKLQDFIHPTKIEDVDDDPADYDIENQYIAKAALTLLEQSHQDIFGKVLRPDEIDHLTSIRPPCRFETIEKDGTTVILDVAHNPSAMEYLVYKLKTTYPDTPFRFVAGMSSDKDLGQCARALLSVTEGSSKNIHLVEAAHPRAATLENILAAERRLETAAHYDFDDRSITKQVLHALDMSKANENEILVVCGSVFLMAETREALGIDEPRDSDYITEMAGAGIRHGQENFGNTKV
jgi:dihydrofolate synthase/folylpolyglutamate synthase